MSAANRECVRCVICEKPFIVRHHGRLTCSAECRAEQHRRYNRAHARSKVQRERQHARFAKWYAANKQRVIDRVTRNRAGQSAHMPSAATSNDAPRGSNTTGRSGSSSQ
jgi:hypothetical protein